MQFANYMDLTFALRTAAAEALTARGLSLATGYSNQSCSAYIEIVIAVDEDECEETFKLRFSDHADRHGSDYTVRIERAVEELRDECGEYCGIEIADWRFEELLAEGLGVVMEAL